MHSVSCTIQQIARRFKFASASPQLSIYLYFRGRLLFPFARSRRSTLKPTSFHRFSSRDTNRQLTLFEFHLERNATPQEWHKKLLTHGKIGVSRDPYKRRSEQTHRHLENRVSLSLSLFVPRSGSFDFFSLFDDGLL